MEKNWPSQIHRFFEDFQSFSNFSGFRILREIFFSMHSLFFWSQVLIWPGFFCWNKIQMRGNRNFWIRKNKKVLYIFFLKFFQQYLNENRTKKNHHLIFIKKSILLLTSEMQGKFLIYFLSSEIWHFLFLSHLNFLKFSGVSHVIFRELYHSFFSFYSSLLLPSPFTSSLWVLMSYMIQ